MTTTVKPCGQAISPKEHFSRNYQGGLLRIFRILTDLVIT